VLDDLLDRASAAAWTLRELAPIGSGDGALERRPARIEDREEPGPVGGADRPRVLKYCKAAGTDLQ